jgi:hypothetical protein
MRNAIETVGIYLTEDERRLLTSLANDLEVREESALRRSEGPEAKTYGATREALRKLMYLPAASAASAERVRAAVRKAIAGFADGALVTPNDRYAAGIADRVVTLLTGATP